MLLPSPGSSVSAPSWLGWLRSRRAVSPSSSASVIPRRAASFLARSRFAAAFAPEVDGAGAALWTGDGGDGFGGRDFPALVTLTRPVGDAGFAVDAAVRARVLLPNRRLIFSAMIARVTLDACAGWRSRPPGRGGGR